MKSPIKWLRGCAFALAALCSSAVAPAVEAPTRILPLGDSLTEGFPGSIVQGGYRNRLYSLLTTAGYNVDFVGTFSDTANPGLPDVNHQGKGGWKIDQIQTALPEWLNAVEDPDVVLLHIGTNDFTLNYQLPSIQTRLGNLIGDIATRRPYAKIIVSTLIPRFDIPALNTQQAAFNAAIPTIVAQQAALGRQVTHVNLNGALTAPDLSADGVHPNQTGYNRMGDAWFPAISAVISPQGTANPPVISRIGPINNLTSVPIVFSKPVSDASASLSNFSISGGLSVTGASLDSSKRIITLTTSTQTPGIVYQLSVSGVRDRTAAQTPIASGASANFSSSAVVNGGFEDNYNGWVQTGNQAIKVFPDYQPSEGARLVAFNNNQAVPNGTLSQTFSTTVGQAYQLTFDHGVIAYNNDLQRLGVNVSGNSVLVSETATINGAGGGLTRWFPKTYSFVADRTSTTLTFTDTSASSSSIDMLVDNVRVNAVTGTGGGPVTPPAQVAFINGSFESGFTGWNSSGSQNSVKVNSILPARDGLNLVEFNSSNSPNDGVLSQTFTTISGTPYTVTFDMGVLAYSTAPQVIEVSATGSGSLASQSFSRNGSGNGSILWATHTLSFTANSSVTTLTFRDRSTTTNAIDLLLDHVRVTSTGGPAPSLQTLTVASSGASSVAITASPADANGNAGGNTGFSRSYNTGTAVTLTAPATSSGANFSKWQKNGTDLTSTLTANVTMDGNHTLTAVYTSAPSVPVNFVNGSFESGLTGWNTSGSPNTVKVKSTLPARDGVNLAEFNGGNTVNDGVLSQTFATAVGATYTVTFDMGVLSYNTAPQVLEVSATGAGSLASQTFSRNGSGNGSILWATHTLEFIANSNSTTLTFRDRGAVTNASDALLDHIRIVSTGGPVPVQWQLTVAASGAPSVAIIASPADAGGNAGGNTGFSRTYNEGTVVSLTAPAVSGGVSFSKWQKNGSDLTTSLTASVTMDSNQTLTAIYEAGPPAPVAFLNGSFEDGTNGWTFTGSHRVIDSLPGYQATDGNILVVLNGGQEAPSGVLTQTFSTVPGETYLLDFDMGATGVAGLQQRLEVTVTGAATLLSQVETITCLGIPAGNWSGRSFVFVADSAATTLRFADVSLSGDNVDLLLDFVRVVADNGPAPVQRALTVASTGASSVAITASPSDVNGNAGGNTGFARSYNDGTVVTLTAPATSGGANFSKWQKNGSDLTSNVTANVTMDGNHTLTAIYTSAPPAPTNFVNGSFEDGENGWTITGSRRVIPSIDAYQATDGGILMVMNGGQEDPTGVVSQTFATTPGQSYNLLMDAGALGGLGVPQGLRITLAGTTPLVTREETFLGNGIGAAWTPLVIPFTANSAATTLTFADISPSTNGADLLVDNIRVVPNTARALTVDSTAGPGVAIAIAPSDTLGNSSGFTRLNRYYQVNTSVSLSAPTTHAGSTFVKWRRNGTDFSTSSDVNVTITDDVTMTAVYTAPVQLLTNGSFEDGFTAWTHTGNQLVSSWSIPTDGVSVLEFNGGNSQPNALISQDFATVAGQTYYLYFDVGVVAYNTSAQALQVSVDGTANRFNRVLQLQGPGDGSTLWAPQAFTFVADSTTTTLAFRDVSPTSDVIDMLLDNVRVTGGPDLRRSLTVISSGAASVAITASPADINGNAGGNTGFGRSYNDGTVVSLTAPAVSAGMNFSKWQKNGTDLATTATTSVTMDGNYTLTAVYTPAPPPPSGFVNGSFELDFTGWTATGSTDSVKVATSAAARDGAKLVEFNSSNSTPDGKLVQTFATTPGATYNLTFDLGVLSYVSSPQRMLVEVNGAASLISQIVSGTGTPAIRWLPQSFTFVADSSSTTLALTDVSTATFAIDMLLDNVKVVTEGGPPVPVQRTLAVASSGATSVAITASPADLNSNAGGNTGFSRTYNDGTVVTLTAPALAGGATFTKWQKNGADLTTNTTANVTMDGNHTLTAVYVAGPPVQVNFINGSFESGLTGWTNSGSPNTVKVNAALPARDGVNLVEFNGGNSPNDGVLSQTFATTSGATYIVTFEMGVLAYSTLPQVIEVTATGSGSLASQSFARNGSGNGSIVWATQTIQFTANSSATTLTFRDRSTATIAIDLLLDHVRVVSDGPAPVLRTLTVASSGASSVAITASPADANGNAGGNTGFGRSYNDGTVVSLTAPATSSGASFSKWQKNGADLTTSTTASVTMDGNHTLTAVYTTGPVQPTFVNGSFEDGADGWNFTGSHRVIPSIDGYQATNGNILVVLNGGQEDPSGILTQSFVTVPGETYFLDFDIGVIGQGGLQQRLAVTVTGNSNLLSRTETITSLGTPVAHWEGRSFTFVADSAATTLMFADASTSGNSVDLLLDHVRVTADDGSTPTERSLTVVSTGASSVAITASPADVYGYNGGNTGFGRTYDTGTVVTLTAPAVSGGANFSKWQKNGADLTTDTTANVTMDDDYTLTAVYAAAPPAPLTFVNGSFESGFTGWTPSGSPDTVKVNSILPARDGVTLVEFNSSNSPNDGVLSQTFATTAGVTYSVTFEMGVLSYPTTAQVLEVAVSGFTNLVTRSFSMNGGGNGTTRWATQTLEFTAESSETTLVFRDRSPSTFAIDLLLDHVRVVPAGGPPAPVQRMLTVASSGASSVAITASPADANGNAGGNTGFNRTYNNGTSVNLTAPATSGGASFSKWQKNGTDLTTNTTANVTMDGNHTLTAVYTPAPPVQTSFVNGSFESGFTGWTTSGSPNTVKVNSILPARDGVSLVEFNSSNSPNDGVLSQTFATTSGATYTVTFDMGVLAYSTAPQILEVSATGSGSLVSQTFSRNGSGNGAIVWTTQSLNFTANSSSTTLTFRDRATATIAIDTLLDHVRVTQNPSASSPAPAAPLPSMAFESFVEPVTEAPSAPVISGTPGDMRIGMSNAPAGLYFLERSDDLKTWTRHSEMELTEPGAVEFTDDEAAADRMFYRIGRSTPASEP